MQRSVSIVVMVFAALFLAAVPSNTQGQQFGIWGQMWGTFVHQVQVAPGAGMAALVTLNVDGTLTVAPSSLHGALPGAARKTSPVHGVWEKTGRKSVGATSLLFAYDASTGVLTGYQRNRCTLEFSDDFARYKGTEFMETLSCATPLTCPNPTDPSAAWTALPGMPASGFPVSGARVIRVAVGPL